MATEAKKVPYVNGSTIDLSVGGKKVPCHVVLTRTWTLPSVHVEINVPLQGSPEARKALGSYGVFAFYKVTAKLFHSLEFGRYNPRMNKDGVGSIEAYSADGEDGAPTFIRVAMEVKGTKLGRVLASVMAKICTPPSASDISNEILSPLGRNVESMNWAATNLCKMIKAGEWSVMVIGGKKTAINASVGEKFDVAYAKKSAKITAPSGGSTPKEVTLCPSPISISSPSALAAVAMAHKMSGFGVVWYDGKKIGVSLPEEEAKRVERKVKSQLRNSHAIATVLNWYSRMAERDKFGTIGSALAAAAVCLGLPISIALTVSSLSTVDPVKVGEAIAATVPKGEK